MWGWPAETKHGVVIGYVGGQVFEGDNIIKVLSTHSEKPILIMESRVTRVTK